MLKVDYKYEFEEISLKIISRYSSNLKYLLPHSYMRLVGIDTAAKLDSIFFKIIKEAEILSFIECGANEASASIMATEMGLKALAIEANPLTFEKVTPEPNNNFAKLNFGLSDRDSWLNFHIPKSNNTAGSATFKPKGWVDYTTQQVQTKKLDDLLDDGTYVNRPFALWIDVEGMQKEVLLGASQTLQNSNCRILKIEVEDIKVFTGQAWLCNDV
ncbi:FkbM family methyltransferase, partial [Planktomarina temperata]|nr:FkbM family methyltransferase [Planktomarina temperata]